MINFFDPAAREMVDIGGTAFQFKHVNVRTKVEVVTALGSLTTTDMITMLDEIKEILSRVIIAVHRNGGTYPFGEVFESLADMGSVKQIMTETVKHCTLDDVQRKNSGSSPEQPCPASAGNAEKPAEPDDAPASDIPEATGP